VDAVETSKNTELVEVFNLSGSVEGLGSSQAFISFKPDRGFNVLSLLKAL
jgi:hypothetical protein